MTLAPLATSPTVDITRLIAAAPLGPIHLRVGVLCALVMLLDGLDGQIIAYLGPSLSREWKLSSPALGQIFSAGLVGMLLGLVVIGPLADRFGRRRTIAVSAALMGLCTLLTATAGSAGELLFYRVVVGIGLGGTMPNAAALVGDYCPDRWRGTLVAAIFTGFSIGSILGGWLTAALVAEYGWRSVLVTAGVVTLPIAPFLWLLLPDSPHLMLRGGQREGLIKLLGQISPNTSVAAQTKLVLSGNTGSRSPPRQIFQGGRATGTLLIWIACFMGLVELYFLNNWLPTLLTQNGLGLRASVIVTTAFSAGGIVGCLSIGRMMDRVGFAPVLAVAFLCGAAIVPSIGLAPGSLIAVFGTIFLAGFFVAGAQIGLTALAVSFYPAAMRSTGVSWALGAGRIGAICGPLLAGWLLGLGWSTTKVLFAASVPTLGAASAMIAMVLWSAHRNRQMIAQQLPQ